MSIKFKDGKYRYFRKPDGGITQAFYSDKAALYRYQQKGYKEIHKRFFKCVQPGHPDHGKHLACYNDDGLQIRSFTGNGYEELDNTFSPLPELVKPEPPKKQRSKTTVVRRETAKE